MSHFELHAFAGISLFFVCDITIVSAREQSGGGSGAKIDVAKVKPTTASALWSGKACVGLNSRRGGIGGAFVTTGHGCKPYCCFPSLEWGGCGGSCRGWPCFHAGQWRKTCHPLHARMGVVAWTPGTDYHRLITVMQGRGLVGFTCGVQQRWASHLVQWSINWINDNLVVQFKYFQMRWVNFINSLDVQFRNQYVC